MSDAYIVDGMTCGGCARSVTTAITRVASGVKVAVDLDARTVTVEGAIAEDAVRQAVEAAGFDFGGRAG